MRIFLVIVGFLRIMWIVLLGWILLHLQSNNVDYSFILCLSTDIGKRLARLVGSLVCPFKATWKENGLWTLSSPKPQFGILTFRGSSVHFVHQVTSDINVFAHVFGNLSVIFRNDCCHHQCPHWHHHLDHWQYFLTIFFICDDLSPSAVSNSSCIASSVPFHSLSFLALARFLIIMLTWFDLELCW